MLTPLFSRVHATLQPALSVCQSVGLLVTFYFFFTILFFWPHCSCPDGLVTSNMAPAHPHATSVAVYPALFFQDEETIFFMREKRWKHRSCLNLYKNKNLRSTVSLWDRAVNGVTIAGSLSVTPGENWQAFFHEDEKPWCSPHWRIQQWRKSGPDKGHHNSPQFLFFLGGGLGLRRGGLRDLTMAKKKSEHFVLLVSA